jgi:uncharacterized protein (DUF2062 family)
MLSSGEMVAVPKEVWWRRWLVTPVVTQLKVGNSPERISWTIALGVVLGVFPIMGSTTLVCLFAGWMLGLNQPVLHIFKTLVYPLHLALILVFIRLGERLHGVPLISFSIPELVARFRSDPLQFAVDFGMAAWHGVSAWLLIAPVVAILINMLILPVLRKVTLSMKLQQEVTP